MIATIYISGVIGEETTLKDVIRQYKSYDKPKGALFKIHSVGGFVGVGDDICEYMDGLKKIHPVNTWTDKAYSIASKIFSKGDKRTIVDGEDSIMVHFPWVEVKGGAEKLEQVAEGLRDIEEDFVLYYSDFLSLDKETARNILDNETFISGAEAVELGLATDLEIATKAVAKYDSNVNLKTSKMSKKSKGKQLLEAFKAFLDLDENGTEAKALVLQDSSGTEIDFSDLEEGDVPSKGDSGTIDGEPVSDGEYIIPSLDNKIAVFVDGKISEVKEEESEETEEGVQARLDAKAEEVQQISVWSQEATNTSFEVGDVMTYGYDGEVYNYGAGEYFVPSLDKNVVTDASGVIVAHKDKVVVSEGAEGVEEDVSAKLEEMLKKVENNISSKYKGQLEEQAKKINALNKLVGSKEFKAEGKDPETNEGNKKNQGGYMAGVLRRKKQ